MDKCIIFNYVLSCGVYYLIIAFVFNLIMYYDTLLNSKYLYNDTLNLIDIIAGICLFYLINFTQTIIFGCTTTIHIFGVNLAIHKFINCYLYYMLAIIKNTNCQYRIHLNCTIKNIKINNTVLDLAQQYILYAIYTLSVLELMSGLITRYNRWYFSKNIIYELIASFVFINFVALLYCLIFIIICCIYIGNNSNLMKFDEKFEQIIFGKKRQNINKIIQQISSTSCQDINV